MGTLTTKITENFTGLNGLEKTTTTLSLTGIDLVNKRIMTATTTEKSILKFQSEEEWGTFIVDDVRYLRITNQDDTNHVLLKFANSAADEFALKLDKGQTFYLNGDLSAGLSTYFAASTSALTSEAFADVSSITAQADSGNCQIEIYIASVPAT